ncbi:MAG: DUF2157 domain-containing protein [Candidatus Omnitrophica bacterium]|nr:DUF2157 domain-containing protein [Candidatus Omnitrophota bacterium]
MNGRNLKWLYQELPILVGKGIISQENAGRIKDYYGQLSERGKKNTFLIISSVVGSLLIGLGIISLIAHNWDQFSRSTRTVLSLAPVVIGILLTGWALAKDRASDQLKESTTAFLTLMIGASISLICQTYNISGSWQSFVLTWMLLSLPLVYLAAVTVPGIIYVIGITCWAIGHIWGDTGLALYYWPLIAVIAPHFIYILKRDSFKVRLNLLSVFLAISTALFTSLLLGNILPHLWMISLPIIFAAMYLAGTHRFFSAIRDWQKPFYYIGELGVVVLLIILSYRWPWSNMDWMFFRRDSEYALWGYLLLLIGIAKVLFFLVSAVKEKRLSDVLLGAAPIVAIAAFSFRAAAMILCNIYFLVYCLERIQSGVRTNKLRILNEGLLLLALLIALRFFDSDINLVIKGLVLIFLGIGFLAANTLFIRRRGGANE